MYVILSSFFDIFSHVPQCFLIVSNQVEDVEEEAQAAEAAVKKILEEAEDVDEKRKDEDTNGDVPDVTKTELIKKKLEEIQLEPKEEEKCESEDEIPEEIEEAATDEEAEKSEGQKNFDRMMKEVDNHDNQDSEELGATESDEVMEVEVDEDVRDAIEKRISGVVENTEQPADEKEDIEVVSKDVVDEDTETEKDVTERELANDDVELKEDETMVGEYFITFKFELLIQREFFSLST